MGIFSKVHFQPRVLTRSSCQSWWMTLMLLQACITHGSAPDEDSFDSFEEDFGRWLTEYHKKSNYFGDTKEKWIRAYLNELIHYDVAYMELYDHYGDSEQYSKDKQRGYVQDWYSKYAKNGRCADKCRKWMRDYDNKWTEKGKRKHFRKTLTKLLSEQDIINRWKKTDDEVQDIFLKAEFKKLHDLGGDPHCLVRQRNEQSHRYRVKAAAAAKRDRQEEEKFNKGYKDGKAAGTAGLSTDLIKIYSDENTTKKIQLMNALYDRFKDLKEHFWKLIDEHGARLKDPSWYDKEYPFPSHAVFPVKLKYSKCEVSGSKLKMNWTFWKKRECNCNMCGRVLSDAHAKIRRSKKKGEIRSCRDKKREGCFNEIHFLDLDRRPRKVAEETKSYDEGYNLGYSEGIQTRNQTDAYRMKCILYKRFYEFPEIKVETDLVSEKYKFYGGAGIRDLKIEYDRCEIESCDSKKEPVAWYNLTKFNPFRSHKNCKACGRLLCGNCRVEEKHENENGRVKKDWYCKHGRGCRWHLPARTTADDDGTEPQKSDSRRLGKINLSDSFWQGFFTSMLILLGTFVVYHLVFQKPSKHPCRKTYIKKKRSTFFKGRTSDVKSRTSVREAKGVFSKVIRRQLSKLDEN